MKGLNVTASTESSNAKIKSFIEASDQQAEYHEDGNYWFFEEQNVDALEAELEIEFSKHDINAYFFV